MLPSKNKRVFSVGFAKSSGLFQYQTNIPTDSGDELSVSGARDDESWIFENQNFSSQGPLPYSLSDRSILSDEDHVLSLSNDITFFILILMKYQPACNEMGWGGFPEMNSSFTEHALSCIMKIQLRMKRKMSPTLYKLFVNEKKWCYSLSFYRVSKKLPLWNFGPNYRSNWSKLVLK